MDTRVAHILKEIPQWNVAQAVVTPLQGGLTNENYRLDIDSESFVLRLCGKNTQALGINRLHERTCGAIAARVGVGPEVFSFDHLPNVQGSRFIQGTPLSAEMASQPATLRRIIQAIRQYHHGPAFPGMFSPFETVRAYHRSAGEAGVSFPEVLVQAFDRMNCIEEALGPLRQPCPCHNDLLAANFIDDGRKIWILDWEYAGMGDPFFDLGNFAINQGLDERQCQLLLQFYFGEARHRDLAHLYLMRLASDLREAFWGFLQMGIASLDFDYAQYAQKHLQRFLQNSDDPRFEEWLAAVASH